MEIAGYAGAFLMGMTLGFFGGGGSILTVPILVYLFSIDAVLATVYSLFIVGFTSLIGSFSHLKQGNIHLKTVLIFGFPSIISVFLTRRFLLRLIPQEILTFGGGFILTKPIALLLLFAVIMLFASYSMIKKRKSSTESEEILYNFPVILSQGAVSGVVTGLVGAGGGFLIIPALVFFAKLPMKKAVGTSLMIIATNALIGFVSDGGGSGAIEWRFLLMFSTIAIAGILSGSYLSKFISNEKLKPAFGWFVLLMGIYIIIKELFFHS